MAKIWQQEAMVLWYSQGTMGFHAFWGHKGALKRTARLSNWRKQCVHQNRTPDTHTWTQAWHSALYEHWCQGHLCGLPQRSYSRHEAGLTAHHQAEGWRIKVNLIFHKRKKRGGVMVQCIKHFLHKHEDPSSDPPAVLWKHDCKGMLGWRCRGRPQTLSSQPWDWAGKLSSSVRDPISKSEGGEERGRHKMSTSSLYMWTHTEGRLVMVASWHLWQAFPGRQIAAAGLHLQNRGEILRGAGREVGLDLELGDYLSNLAEPDSASEVQQEAKRSLCLSTL